MLKRNKSDWFAVVATDLFCGVLAAVIILDAVAPKEVSSSSSEVMLIMTYASSANACGKNDVVFQFRDASSAHNTLENDLTTAALIDGKCRLEAFFPEVNLTEGVKDPLVLVAEYRGDLQDADIEISGIGESLHCRADGTVTCTIY